MMKRPIIVIGSGRAGSTIFSRTLSRHKSFVYMSQITTRLPRLMFLSRWYLRFSKLPIIGLFVHKIVKLAEAYPLWNIIAKCFARPMRNIDENDVKPEDAQRIRHTLNKLSIGKDSRLLIKITGWPRMGYLLKVFPDAIFVHIVRDGRAVANSLINSDFWWGEKGPEGWRLGPLPESQIKLYEKHNKSIIALAGIYWNILMDSTEKDFNKYKPKHITVKYEDFCKNQLETTRFVCDYCGINWSEKFEKSVKSQKIDNMNYKWTKHLSKQDVDILNDVTKLQRNKLGYTE